MIKFRGKCKDTGDLVYGSYIDVPNSALIVSPSTCENHNAKLLEYTENGTVYRYACKVYVVDKNTVTQLVGYDKHNKEVYSDDIRRKFCSSYRRIE